MRTQTTQSKLKELKELAHTALKESNPNNIDSYIYFGALDREHLWVATFGRNRDSDTLSESNFERIHETMLKMFGDDYVTVEGASHWACGWVEQIMVKMFHDDGSITPAGLWALKTNKSLSEDYPVFDECDYYDRINEKCAETLDENELEWAQQLAESVGLIESWIDWEDLAEDTKKQFLMIVGAVYQSNRDWSGDEDAWFQVSDALKPNQYGELRWTDFVDDKQTCLTLLKLN